MMKVPREFIWTYADEEKDRHRTRPGLDGVPMGNVCAHRRRPGAMGMRMLAGAKGLVNAFGRAGLRAKAFDRRK